jgi:hypothetical protein
VPIFRIGSGSAIIHLQAKAKSTLLLQKIFPKYSLCPLIQVAEMLFIDGS